MERSALRDAIDKVAAEDRDGWSGAARSARLLELLEYRERLDAKVLRSVSEWDVQRAWAEDGACTPVAWLTYRAPVPKSEAVRLLRGARLAREHARTGKLLARSTALRLACDSATGRVVRRGDG